jgi:hypothetical protein
MDETDPEESYYYTMKNISSLRKIEDFLTIMASHNKNGCILVEESEYESNTHTKREKERNL